VFAGPGNDRISALAQADAASGTIDRVKGGRGNDIIRVRDGAIDKVLCGPGRDEVFADRRDRVRGGNCERVFRAGPRPGADEKENRA
jgi:hypothetical protein